MKISCVSPSKKVLVEHLELPSHKDPTVADLKHALAKAKRALYPARQRWTFDGKVLADDDKPLKAYGVKDGATLTVKDLGPQIGYRTVFLVEYLGPLLICPLFYALLAEPSAVQTYAFYCVMAHFVKREFETIFVHRFSHGTMPMRNIFKNSAHYWLLSGLLLSWDVFSMESVAATVPRSSTYIAACLALFTFAQASNFATHVILRNLRPPGSKERKIPYGYGFNLVSCPNYFFETLSWTAVLALTQSWAVAVFMVVGVGQMYLWAVKKHRAYKKDFPNYPKNRKAMFPFIA